MNPGAKQPLSLLLDAELVATANARGLDVSAVAEDALRACLLKDETRDWLAENREAIAAQNAWSAERGLFSDEFRGW